MGSRRYNSGFEWPAYVSVAERKAKANKHINEQKKKGKSFNPVMINGRKIASTFWGISWCENLESYSDYANRLPRGRTYVRNGSVIDLQIGKGKIEAQVMGSSLYRVTIQITALADSKWSELVKVCAGKIDSMIELLQGKFSKAVMQILTEKEKGLFPKPKEIKMNCTCPDAASMCKHIAAVLYGVGACLDNQPERLFDLRNVDHFELIAKAGTDAIVSTLSSQDDVDDRELSSIFGIEIDSDNIKTDSTNSTKDLAKDLTVKKTKVVKKPIVKKKIKPADMTPSAIKSNKIAKRKKTVEENKKRKSSNTEKSKAASVEKKSIKKPK